MQPSDWSVTSTHCNVDSTRVNVGGLHTMGYMQRLLQLKYPGLQTHVTLSRAQEIVSHHTYTALDYSAELREWAEGRHERDYRLVQLPYTQVRLAQLPYTQVRLAQLPCT